MIHDTRCGSFLAAAGLGLALCLAACTSMEQASEAKPTGFLGNYSELEKGGGETALLHYINQDVDFSAYDKIIVDPITLWFHKRSDLMKEDRIELSQMAKELYAAVKKHLSDDYTFVEGPHKGAMRLRIGLTEATSANEAMDAIMTYTPAIIIDGARKLTVGTHAFVGKAAVEIEILDSMTNQRLAAAVDERQGGRNTEGTLDKWSDVREAFEYWAEKIDTRLTQLRAGQKNFDD